MKRLVKYRGKKYRVTVNDPNVIERVLQNQDSDGKPQPRESGGNGWQDRFYDFKTESLVFRHLVHNYFVNGLRANQLDGWADVADDAVTFERWN